MDSDNQKHFYNELVTEQSNILNQIKNSKNDKDTKNLLSHNQIVNKLINDISNYSISKNKYKNIKK